LKRALRVWEEVIELDFEEVDHDDADIIIYFGFRKKPIILRQYQPVYK